MVARQISIEIIKHQVDGPLTDCASFLKSLMYTPPHSSTVRQYAPSSPSDICLPLERTSESTSPYPDDLARHPEGGTICRERAADIKKQVRTNMESLGKVQGQVEADDGTRHKDDGNKP